jgi:hypothetical protein
MVLLALAGCGSSRREAIAAKGDHDGAFIPRAHRDGRSVVLPLVFPDGTEANLLYPPELDLAGLGVSPSSSGELQGKSRDPERNDVVGRDFWILHGDLRDVLAKLDGGRPPRLLAKYEGAEGRTVGFWDLRSEGPYLGFQFGRWAVLVYDYADNGEMTDSERASWASSLSGRETTEGFLILEASGPLRLARAGEHAGPELRFGDSPDHGLSLFPGKCALFRNRHDAVAGVRRVDRSPGFANWCLSPWMEAQATGSESFVDALLRNLEIGDVRSGSPVPAE